MDKGVLILKEIREMGWKSLMMKLKDNYNNFLIYVL